MGVDGRRRSTQLPFVLMLAASIIVFLVGLISEQIAR